jgi:hypothetical protein
MTYDESMKITFRRVAADQVGTYTAVAAISIAAGTLLASGVDLGGFGIAAIALGGLAIKGAVSYVSEQWKNTARVLRQLT